MPIGQHVLVIADSQQARIVPDYTVQIAPPAAKPAAPSATAESANTEINIGPLPQAPDAVDTSQLAPVPVAADPAAMPPPAQAATPGGPQFRASAVGLNRSCTAGDGGDTGSDISARPKGRIRSRKRVQFVGGTGEFENETLRRGVDDAGAESVG